MRRLQRFLSTLYLIKGKYVYLAVVCITAWAISFGTITVCDDYDDLLGV